MRGSAHARGADRSGLSVPRRHRPPHHAAGPCPAQAPPGALHLLPTPISTMALPRPDGPGPQPSAGAAGRRAVSAGSAEPAHLARRGACGGGLRGGAADRALVDGLLGPPVPLRRSAAAGDLWRPGGRAVPQRGGARAPLVEDDGVPRAAEAGRPRRDALGGQSSPGATAGRRLRARVHLAASVPARAGAALLRPGGSPPPARARRSRGAVLRFRAPVQGRRRAAGGDGPPRG